MQPIVSNEKARETFWTLQNTVIQMIGDGAALKVIADVICREAEKAAGAGVACSILQVREGRLWTLAAPSLSAKYSEALNGLQLGPDVGACGAAAYRCQEVVTTNLRVHPNWIKFPDLTSLIEANACWSSPICSRDGSAIGTFAFYFEETRGPSDLERELVARCTQLCAIAMESEETKNRLIAIGYTDTLTDLGNRAAFHELLLQMSQGRTPFALFLLDLNNLKGTNDMLSHVAGDALIQAVGSRLLALGDAVHAYRLGGDEFGVLIKDCADQEQMASFAASILAAVNQPVDFQGHMMSCYVTIGGVCSHPPENAQLVAQNADFALYHGKATRRGGYVPFEPGMRTAITRRLSTVSLVDQALREDRVTPFYQPLIKLQTAEIIGLEALARVVDVDGNVIAAGDFQDAFSEPRLAQMLTDAMLASVAKDLRVWLDDGIPIQHVGVNVTTADFQRGDLDTRIAAAFAAERVPLKHIVLEVNEAVFMGGSGDYRIASSVEKLRENGLLVALDDFGTGYASLTHLLEFPVDLIKVDKSFVQRLCDDRGSEAIIEALITLATKLDMKIVAEGIETQAQADRLMSMGCNLGQGYHYSRPVSRSVVTDLLKLFSQGASRQKLPSASPKFRWPGHA